MAIVNYPEFLQTQSYEAKRLRFQQEDFTPAGEGVMGQSDFRVSQRGAGANMSVDIAAGSAVVRGDTIARQGLYHVVNDAVINAAITANASGNPRIDRVTLQCSDSTDSGSGTDISVINVIAGTPTGGATLDNLSGAAAIPNNQLHLADVAVANGAASILDANIRSRRSFAKTLVPPLVGLTDVDQVPFIPLTPNGPQEGSNAGILHSTMDLHQVAGLMYLPRRIVSATKIRWRYRQSATTALTGNYVIAICDASGRPIVNTGTVAFTGAAVSLQSRSETITATTFEAGPYYVFFGIDTASGDGANQLQYHGLNADTSQQGITVPVSGPCQILRSGSGGTTVPSTILGMTDVWSATGNSDPPVPIVTLSVG